MLDNVLTAEECAAIIAETEAGGYERALVTIGRNQTYAPEVRLCDRCMVDSPMDAGVLFERVRPFLPAAMPAGLRAKPFALVGLNERLRILRYGAGQYFSPHFDAAYSCPGQESQLTFIVFLAGATGGGECRFHSEKEYDGSDRFTGPSTVSVAPRPGRALVFEHELFHEGAIVDEVRVCPWESFGVM